MLLTVNIDKILAQSVLSLSMTSDWVMMEVVSPLTIMTRKCEMMLSLVSGGLCEVLTSGTTVTGAPYSGHHPHLVTRIHSHSLPNLKTSLFPQFQTVTLHHFESIDV